MWSNIPEGSMPTAPTGGSGGNSSRPVLLAANLKGRARFGLGAALVFLLTAVGLSHWLLREFEADAHDVARTHAEGAALNALEAVLREAQSGVRGYVITGDERWLEACELGRRKAPGHLARLDVMVRHPDQRALLPGLKAQTERVFAGIEARIQVRREQGFEAARALVEAGEGRRAMDAFCDIKTMFEAGNRQLLAAREAELARTKPEVLWADTVLGLLGLCAAIWAWRISREELRQRVRIVQANEELNGLNEELAQTNRALETTAQERDRVAQALHQLNAELEQTVDVRTAALADSMREHGAVYAAASHNLRTPLRALNTHAAMLRDGFHGLPDAEREQHLRAISHNALLAARYVEDLLAFNEIYRRALKPEWCAAGVVAREAWAALEPKRIGRAIAFTCGALPACQAEPALLKELFLLLLSNAIKFSRGREEEADGQRRAVYWVRDNGIGFDMKFERRIFGLFQRLNWTEDYSGTGCGLALAHRIAQRHGGRVWAESELGKGATFYIELPGGGGGDVGTDNATTAATELRRMYE